MTIYVNWQKAQIIPKISVNITIKSSKYENSLFIFRGIWNCIVE